MTHPPINLELLTPSRKALRPGDIFVVRPRDRDFLFGRVIDVDASVFDGVGGANLIYIYDAWSKAKDTVPPLRRDQLLIPPVIINRLGWSRGFMETVEHRPLASEDVFAVHCFVDDLRKVPRYFDERRRELPGPVVPLASFGLSSYRSLDDNISDAIGMPLAPDE